MIWTDRKLTSSCCFVVVELERELRERDDLIRHLRDALSAPGEINAVARLERDLNRAREQVAALETDISRMRVVAPAQPPHSSSVAPRAQPHHHHSSSSSSSHGTGRRRKQPTSSATSASAALDALLQQSAHASPLGPQAELYRAMALGPQPAPSPPRRLPHGDLPPLSPRRGPPGDSPALPLSPVMRSGKQTRDA